MDLGRSHKAKTKGKEKITEVSDHPKRNTKRGDNWRYHETSNLIDAIDQVQDRRGKVGFSFNSVENQEIYTLFKKGIPDSTRDKGRVVNRIKVLLKMFKICDELAKISGGGWDDSTHRPIAPNEKEYDEMVMAKGENGRFLLKNNFPWYRKMESMVGGQSARGDKTKEDYSVPEPEPEPIHCLLDSHMSLHENESSQGSSDSPVAVSSGAGPDSEQQPQQRRRRAETPSTDKGRRSDGSFTRSMNSGSKRKSTDEFEEPTVRGKRYKDKNRSRQAEGKRLSDAGFEIAKSMREDTVVALAASEERKACCTKLKELDFDVEEYDYALNMLDNAVKRNWFMMNDRHVILSFVRRRLPPKETESNPRPPPYAYTPIKAFPTLTQLPTLPLVNSSLHQTPLRAITSFIQMTRSNADVLNLRSCSGCRMNFKECSSVVK